MLQNIPKEKILEIVKQGPTIPSKIVKIVGGDTMLIGAILSTMISTGEVKYTIVKVGGSPIYYVPEQEEKLEDFIQYLNDKDHKTVQLLKEQKILQDSKQDPLTKFSLKTIKDFAKPFEVNRELFYRYFLINREDAEKLAADILTNQEIPTQEVMTATDSTATDKAIAMHQAITPETVNIKDALKSERHPTTQQIVKHKRESHVTSDFLELIKTHIHKLGLDIVGKEKIKKTEYALILKNHDSNEYHYCVAKDKKTINEGDLSTAFVFSHQKKMPCIFLITGHLSKKAESMSQKEFKDMKIEQL
jgi:hypothetical protein